MTTITKCKCGGRMDPATDGLGGVADRCSSCGSRDGNGKTPALNGVTIRVRTCVRRRGLSGHHRRRRAVSVLREAGEVGRGEPANAPMRHL